MLETRDLLLRIGTPSDSKALYENYWRYPEAAQYMFWKPVESQSEADELMVKVIGFQKNGTSFCVCLKETNEVIGLAGVKDLGDGVIEDSGVGVGPKYVGRGFGTQITMALLQFSFETLKAKVVRFGCFEENQASERMILKCGFTFKKMGEEGIRKWDGKKYRSKIFEITAKEWRKNTLLNRIEKLDPIQWKGYELNYYYHSKNYRDVIIEEKDDRITIDIVKKTSESIFVKDSESTDKLFQPWWDDSEACGIIEGNRVLAVIETAVEGYSNRLRVTELWIADEYHRLGIGTALMDIALKRAKDGKRRVLMLETQSCNEVALEFYFKYGFKLIGFNTCDYKNNDIERKEVRFELGIFLDY